MPEKSINWTDQQKRAIAARGSDVLVTASAGTGKTAVLSGRCVDIVRDKSLCPDVWSILVLTFTEMAAEQMCARIAELLQAEYEQSGDPHIRYQLMLLPGADISTIHSFCKRLITEYFYKLGLDPTFRVIDSDEAKLLKNEMLEKTIDWAWQQGDKRAALEQLLYHRDLRTTAGFPAKIIELSNFLEGVVSQRNWCGRAIVLAEAVNSYTGRLGERQKKIINEKLRQILSRLRHTQKLYKNEGGEGDWAEKLEDTHIRPVEQSLEFLKADDWDKCADAIRNFTKPTTYKPKDLDNPVNELLQDIARGAVEKFKKLSQLAIVNPDYLDKLGGSVGLQTKVLIELVKQYDRLYSQAKRETNCLDFADLEHHALRLLTKDVDSENELSPSETAIALRSKYKYIFIDEYQDINPVQKAILEMLSTEGNIFVVGDVKQSIYAWRGAEPKIFIKDLKSASADPKNAPKALRVDLNANFRSARKILDFVNKIFSRIMTSSFGEVDYDESAQLKPAQEHNQDETDAKNAVEFHILDEKSIDSEDENQNENESNENVINSRQRQAAMIAQRIRQMVGANTGKPEFQIYDKKQQVMRDVEYRDIVILMRSLAGKANEYVEILQLAGVPASCQATAGYFEATEITDCLCLLKVLDNPHRDIELAALLRSPFFKISDTELAKIKLHSSANEETTNFYDCVIHYCENGPDAKLASRLKDITNQIENWRTAVRRGKLADLIWEIYRQKHLLSFVSALPNGQVRRANLLKLHDRAIQFEGFATSGDIASLTRFVEFIEKLQETGQDWSPAEPPESAGNAVRIISIHKSKGLEFPVVFFAELQSQFNLQDIHSDVITNTSDTLGLQIIDQQSNTKYKSLAHDVIAEEKNSTAMEEEMRILYVATTRARERLILTASQKRLDCGRIISKGFLVGPGTVPDWLLRDCHSSFEWILYGLCNQKSLHNAFETHFAERAQETSLFDLKVYQKTAIEQLTQYVVDLKSKKLSKHTSIDKIKPAKQKESKQLRQIKKSLVLRYRFEDTVALPAKQSVTQLTHRNDEYVKFDVARPSWPCFQGLQARATKPRQIGTATHLVISQLDLSKSVTKDTIEKTKEKLLNNSAITEAVAEHINTQSIISFFESDLGKTALNAWPNVRREWPFTFALPASEFSGGASEEIIVVQGIIDMLIQTPQGLTLIDFKTDNITNEQIIDYTEHYRQQLALYSRAASAILKSRTIAKWLYFLKPGCGAEIS